MPLLECQYCGQAFVAQRCDTKYHSGACRKAAHDLEHSREGSRLKRQRLARRDRIRRRNGYGTTPDLLYETEKQATPEPSKVRRSRPERS